MLLVRLAVLVSLLPFPAAACLWDRDTLASEARGRLDVLSTVLGDFEHPTPRFYQLRAERVRREIEAQATPAAALFDDLAVALDQMGQSTEAIEWMQRKTAAVARLLDPKEKAEQEYRRLANLGTFHAHRWFRNPARAGDLADLRSALARIDEAIALNPDAHFGREKYQRQALEWYRLAYEQPGSDRRVSFLPEKMTKPEAEAALKGICGIIQLGNAWESVDLFLTLQSASQRAGHASLAILALARAKELLIAGKRSLNPALPDRLEGARLQAETDYTVEPKYIPELLAYFKAGRAVADANRAARQAFAEAQFAGGKHPDTEKTFWQGAPKAKPLPAPPKTKRD